MKRRSTVLPALLCLAAVAAVATTSVLPTTGAVAQPPGARTTVLMTPSAGWDVFTPTPTLSGYRTAPSVIVNGDGSIDLWTCGPNGSGTSIFYRRSEDGGKTWTPDVVALRPRQSTAFAANVCDPSVVQLGKYYYLAFAGTSNADNTVNQVFLGRSTSPAGPFRMWDGDGWLQTPESVVAARPGFGSFGPSMVVKGGTLYLYYSNSSFDSSATPLANPRSVSTAWMVADVQNPEEWDEWPSTLTGSYGATAIDRPGVVKPDGNGLPDSVDVKYDVALGRFVAVGTEDRFTDSSYLTLYESTNGTTFTKAVVSRGDWQQGAGNAGLSGDPNGLLQPAARSFVAYSTKPVPNPPQSWPTHLSPVTLTTASTGAISAALGGEASSWTVGTGSWSSTNGVYASTDAGARNATTTATGFVFGDTVTFDVGIRLNTGAASTGWAGVNIAKVLATDTYLDSGYTVRVYPDGSVSLFKGGEIGNTGVVVRRKLTGNDPTKSYVHLRVVASHRAVSVFFGGQQNGAPVFTYVDDSAVFTGGSVSLVTSSAAAGFAGFSASDHVPVADADSIWQQNTGTWELNRSSGAIKQTLPVGGQLNLLTTPAQPGVGPFAWWGGDGTYRATVQIAAGGDATRWAGINLVNPNANPLWTQFSGGYLVLLRANGTAAIWHGSRQVTGDVPTGTDPVDEPVDLRVVKTGDNIQVYVGHDTVFPVFDFPKLNYDDPNSESSVHYTGGLGLAAITVATFTDVSYDAAGGPTA